MLDIIFGCPSPPPVHVDGDEVKIIRGPAGDDGKDGETPYIGENGNWWLGSEDTGTPASVGEHGDLQGRDQPRQHPIDAIDGLREVIDNLPAAMTADELRKILLNGGNENA